MSNTIRIICKPVYSDMSVIVEDVDSNNVVVAFMQSLDGFNIFNEDWYDENTGDILPERVFKSKEEMFEWISEHTDYRVDWNYI